MAGSDAASPELQRFVAQMQVTAPAVPDAAPAPANLDERGGPADSPTACRCVAVRLYCAEMDSPVGSSECNLPAQDRAKANEVVAMLTEKCWDKCMSYPGKSLSSKVIAWPQRRGLTGRHRHAIAAPVVCHLVRVSGLRFTLRARFRSQEEQCMMNCARRFLDTAQFLKRAMEDQH